MRKSLIGMIIASAAVAACTTPQQDTFANAEPLPAPPPAPSCTTPIQGAMLGYPAGGMPGAVWADDDGDGLVDGYYYGGQFYCGVPPVPPPGAGGVRRGERG